ncbi:MAG: hypothetical protein ACI8ZN_000363 [Bacteroidia bacterium]|jgi:hypothetical protein
MKSFFTSIALLALAFFVLANQTMPFKQRLLHVEKEIQLCQDLLRMGHNTEAQSIYNEIRTQLDSLTIVDSLQKYSECVPRLSTVFFRLDTLASLLAQHKKVVQLEGSQSHALVAVASTNNKSSQTRTSTTSTQEQILDLMKDTLLLNQQVASLSKENLGLKTQLTRFTSGVYVGLGFGYNYFLKGPKSYYVKPDSSLGSYGQARGTSFILSGFMAYKIKPKHSVIFNVPLGDFTNRDDFKIGLFNKKMAGGLGYGYNVGSVSMILIVNLSPYDVIEYEVLKNKKFSEEEYALILPENYPSTTAYSPSFTVGFSYNFLASDKVKINSF